MEREFEATGTTWWLRSEAATPGLFDLVERLVREYEATLSRFLPDSALSRLNRERRAEDEVLADVIASAERARRITRGAFDARVGAAVCAAGYDRNFNDLGGRTVPTGGSQLRPEVLVFGSTVVLLGHGALDLGGIAKGWTVDRAAELLGRAGPCVVDGGGDIRVVTDVNSEAWTIGIGEGLAVDLREGAVATSSTLKRRWGAARGEAHHIIDPALGRPATEAVTSAVVVARDAATADALATAVVARPRDGMRAVTASGGEVLVRHPGGAWKMSPGLRRLLR